MTSGGHRAFFHIPADNASDEDEPVQDSTERDSGTTNDGSSTSDHLDGDRWAIDKQKDDTRRYHALMELLTSEVGYVENLRSLVDVSTMSP